MKLQSLFLATAIGAAALFSSCNKTDSITNPGGGSGGLAAGKGTITFSTSGGYGSSNAFDGTNTLYSSAIRQASTAYDQVTIQAIQYAGIDTKTANFIILCKKGLTTSSGTITADFANKGSDDIKPILTISNSANPDQAYGSESGTVTITKLTSTEIEGTFSGKFINEDKGTSTMVSSGKFAGKF